MIAINNKNSIFFALLRSSIYGNQLNNEEKDQLTEEVIQQVYSVAKKHDVAHLLALALKNNGFLLSEYKQIDNELILAIYRYEQMNYEYHKLCNALEAFGVPFVPLKGSVLRNLYPEPWMRTSCDIDILIREDYVDKVAEYLVNSLGYIQKGKGSHDISLFSPRKVHIELHYTLIEDKWANESSKVLSSVWDTTILHEGYKCWLEMSDELFYLYHIAHMAKHFENGGCGVRPFIDLAILEDVEYNKQKRDELLKKGNLLRFAEVSRKLCKVWFNAVKHDDVSEQMESFILRGGVYGTSENRIGIQQQRKGGKIKLILYKVFLPYDSLKYGYPILQKHRWLTPIMEVHRWFRLVFGGHAKRSLQEIKYNSNISQTEAENIQVFLNNIGL